MQVIDLLQKLIAHEKSARSIGNLAEAEAFAAKAQELLTKHKLEMSDVEFAEQEVNEPIADAFFSAAELLNMKHKRTSDNWISLLISGIARANFCKVLQKYQSNCFSIVGSPTDRATTIALFSYLSNACLEMAPREADAKWDGTGTRRSYISSFKLGFGGAIYDRLEVKKAELKAGAQEQGLIRLDQIEKAVNEKFKELFPNTSRPAGARLYNRNGYDAGHAYGSVVGINGMKRLGA